MSGAEAVLSDVRRRGIELQASGDKLRFRPADAVDEELRARLAAHKPELLRILSQSGASAGTNTNRTTADTSAVFDRTGRNPGPDAGDNPALDAADPALDPLGALSETDRGYLVPDKLPPSWREWYEERAAIREFEGNEPREHAEAGARSRRSGLADRVATQRFAERPPLAILTVFPCAPFVAHGKNSKVSHSCLGAMMV